MTKNTTTRLLILRIAMVAIVITGACAMPVAVGAQSEDLRAAIRAEILKDPRAAGIPSAQIEHMVDLLTEEAEAQGMEPEQIAQRAEPAEEGRLGQILQTVGTALAAVLLVAAVLYTALRVRELRHI